MALITKGGVMADIKFDRNNYREHNERNKELIRKSLKDCGAGRSILIDNDNEIIAGNGIYEQAQALGIKTKIIETDGTELVVVKRTDLNREDEKRQQMAIMDNSTSDSSSFIMAKLAEDVPLIKLESFGVNIVIPEDDGVEKTSKYTRKISLPIYEITGEKPTIAEMLNTEKADKLIAEIKKHKFDKELESFLISCATRLYEFNYSNIAEYYAHQNKEVQEVMEKLALVLIDLNAAIENGYVELNQFIENCFLQDKEDEGESDVDE